MKTAHRSVRQVCAEAQKALCWKQVGLALWQHKGFLLLSLAFLWVMGSTDTRVLDAATSTVTAQALASVMRAQVKPVVFGVGFVLGMLLCAFTMPRWAQTLRGLCLVMVTTLAFWGGVYATTYVYTCVIAETSTIVLSQPTAHERIPE